MPNKAREFASGFVQSIAGVLNQRQQAEARQKEQWRSAQLYGLQKGLEDGVIGLESLPDALSVLFGDEPGKKPKAVKGQVDPREIVSSVLGNALGPGQSGQMMGSQDPMTSRDAAASVTGGGKPLTTGQSPLKALAPGQGGVADPTPPPAGGTFLGVPLKTPEEVNIRKAEADRDLLARRMKMALDFVAAGVFPDIHQAKAALRIPEAEEKAVAMPSDYTLNPGDVRFSGRDNREVARGLDKPVTANTPNLGSFEDYVGRRFGANPTADQIEQARKSYMQADDRPQAVPGMEPGDAKAIADSIIAGDQPPTMTGLYRMAGPVRAELARQGYDLTKATQDWVATQRYLQTLNGSQQIRLRQATEVVAETVPLVRELSKSLADTAAKTGKFTAFNAMTLAAARQGVLGQDAQKAAVSLTAQIRDMQAELAVMFRGGYAATNDALKQAQDVLSGNWSGPTLNKALDLIEKNARIRLNSIKAVGAIGGRDENPYAPAGTTTTPATGQPTPTHRFDPATGKLTPVQ